MSRQANGLGNKARIDERATIAWGASITCLKPTAQSIHRISRFWYGRASPVWCWSSSPENSPSGSLICVQFSFPPSYTQHPPPPPLTTIMDTKHDLARVDSFDEDMKAEAVHTENWKDEAFDPHKIQKPASIENLSEEELIALQKKATRKLDLSVMPVMLLLYILNYLDLRNSLGLAPIFISRHNNTRPSSVFSSQDISLSRFPVTWSSVESRSLPSESICSCRLICRLSLTLVDTFVPSTSNNYICLACALWGVVSGCTGVVKSYDQLLACRVLLGVTEAAFFPGAIFYLSCCYTKKQMALRTAILYSGSQLGNAFGGLLCIAILKLSGKHGIEGWQWLFIVEGVATVGCALCCALILPNTIRSARWYSDTEKDFLEYTLQVDRGQKDNSEEFSTLQAFKMTVSDPKTWLLMGILFSTYVAAAVTNFFPSVVATLKYSRNITYCLTAPPYLLCVVCIMINGWHSDKTQERFLHIVCPLMLTMLANIIAVSTLNTAARYVAMMMMPASFYSSSIVTLSWISGSTNGPSIKRALVLALINTVSNTPNVFTSYLYTSGPRYLSAFCVNLAAAVVAILFAVATRIYLSKQNVRLENGEDTGTHGPTAAQIQAGFRYPL
ncbi:Permease of the major facilitator superfamily [Phaffia rhodozyma]|uniref:Permease of the major facilitator superfamily n=1 Tax=Phaffia rhodozyma TaxID=264483 RepID=A0A0F7SRI9_PHARH|nr:Permease of the major facilitator superfamily [Phaffia rhodozyma]